jgi:hypothetical protein
LVDELYSTFTTDYKSLHFQQHSCRRVSRAPEFWIFEAGNLQIYVKTGRVATIWEGRGAIDDAHANRGKSRAHLID